MKNIMRRINKFILLMFLMFATLPLVSCDISNILGTNEVQEFNIVFMVDDTLYHQVTIKEGEMVQIPSNPIKEGYC